MPIVPYGQFEAADRQTRELVTRSVESRSRLIAKALSPILAAADQPTGPALNRALADYATDGTILKLMLHPAGLAGPGTGLRDFYYVAASPESGTARIGAELDLLAQRGVLDRLGQSCAGDMSLELRHRQADGRDEVLTALGVWRSLRHFRDVAQDIRQTSEENTHSFKAPIATIDASLSPLRRLVAPDNERATRSLAIIDRGLDRLRSLVNAAQRVDNTIADIIETPRTAFDLTKVIADSPLQYRELSAGGAITVTLPTNTV